MSWARSWSLAGVRRSSRRLRALLIGIDLGLLAMAYYAAFALRGDLTVSPPSQSVLWSWLPVVLLTQIGIYFVSGIHPILWRYVSLWDLTRIALIAISDGIALPAITSLSGVWFPRSVYVLDPLLIIIFLGGVRIARRLICELPSSPPSKRILIYGAGDAGEMIARDMKHNPYYGYLPVGFIDDDRSKLGLRIQGFPILGTRDELPALVKQFRLNEILLAMPRVSRATVRGIMKSLETVPINVTILPNLRDLMHRRVTMSDIREISLDGLLGRPQVHLGKARPRQLIAGRRVLVTGAGGSVGTELCRQIASLEPAALVMFERYENGLFAIEHELSDRGCGAMLAAVVGDVCDHARVAEALVRHQIDTVFHAAAHKHVPLMELSPCEAVKNNVRGTRVMVTEAERRGVERFILVSTDKAVNPSSVMGASKRVAELVVEGAARRTGRNFAAVRFGNVMGSNGSVVPRFLAQIKQGGPLTVTHPEMRRFFMLIPEAVELLLHSAALIEPGAIYILEMGEQIRIADIAHHMARLAGFVPNEDIEIVYTGVRPGEKLSEELVAQDERMSTTQIQGIAQVRAVTKRDWVALEQQIARLESHAEADRESDLLRELGSILPTFRRSTAKELASSRPTFDGRMPLRGAGKPNQSSREARSLPSV